MQPLTIPAADFGDNPDNTEALNFMSTGRGALLHPAGPKRWGIAVCHATPTTPTIRVERNFAVAYEPVRWASVPGYQTPNPTASVKVPWREGVWQVPNGTDGMVIIWRADGWRFEILNLRRALFGLFGSWVCDRMHLVPPGGCVPETHTATGSGGLSQLDGLVLAESIDNGVIGHAMAIAARNIEYGPGATAYDGHRVEHPGGPGAKQRAKLGLLPGRAPGMNPGGFRLRLDIEDAAIDAWLNSRYAHGRAIRRTARTVVRAAAIFGVKETTTCDIDPFIVFESQANPDAAEVFIANGLATESQYRNLLTGIEQYGTWRVVNQPMSEAA